MYGSTREDGVKCRFAKGLREEGVTQVRFIIMIILIIIMIIVVILIIIVTIILAVSIVSTIVLVSGKVWLWNQGISVGQI